MSLCYLLAAGQGRRLRPFTEARPKPCLEFLTLPLAYYGFYLCRQAGIDQFIMNKHHLPEQIDRLAEDLNAFCSNIETVDETDKLLGSGGALWNARSILEEHEYFLVVNADEVLIPEDPQVISTLIQKFKLDQPLCTLLTCDHPELMKTLKPVWVDGLGHVKGFGMDKPEGVVDPVHYTGYKVFSRKILDLLPEGESNIFYDVLDKAIKNGERVTTLHIDRCHWHETGNFDSFLQASRSIAHQCLDEVNKRLQFFVKPAIEVHKTEKALVVHTDTFKVTEKMETSGLIVAGDRCQVTEDITLEDVFLETESQASGTLTQTMVFREST